MNMLADANKPSPGRWVLMPRKGERFLDPQQRIRIRIRRRRRQIFMVLLEATALTLIIGLFPPLRGMLFGAGICAFLLLAYAALLVRIRVEEEHRDRVRRSVAAMGATGAPASLDQGPRYAAPTMPGVGTVVVSSNGTSASTGYHASANGVANEHANERSGAGDVMWGSGVRIIDDDIHVVVKRPDEVPAEVLADLLESAR